MASLNPNVFEIPEIRTLVGQLSLTNLYQVNFSGFAGVNGSRALINHLQNTTFRDVEDKIIVNDFLTRDLGLLCSDASLPSSSYATAEVKDNFMGITQEFAHTRIYTDADFTFYIDKDYAILRAFEGWMDYISGGSEEPQSFKPGYYRRFVYPDDYKINALTITKFERNYKSEDSLILVYTFVNAFPKTLTPVSVSYGPADLLKVTVTFNYDRYLVERKFVSQDVELLQRQYERQLSRFTGGGTLIGNGTADEARKINQNLADQLNIA